MTKDWRPEWWLWSWMAFASAPLCVLSSVMGDFRGPAWLAYVIAVALVAFGAYAATRTSSGPRE